MLKIKELIRKFMCLALAVNIMLAFMFISNNSVVSAEDDILSQSAVKQDELRSKNDELKAKLEQLRESKENKKEYKRTLEEQIYVVRQQVKEINSQIEELKNTIEEKQKDIDKSEKTKSEKFVLLKERLKAIYMAGGDTYAIDIILKAKSFEDILDKAEIVRRVSNHDANLIEGLKETVKKLSEEKDSINKNKEALDSNKEEVESKQSELDSLIEETDSLVNNLSDEEKRTLGKIDENDAEMIAINNEINAYFANQRAEAEAKAKAEEEEKRVASEEASDSQDSSVSQSPQNSDSSKESESSQISEDKSEESFSSTSSEQNKKQAESSVSQPKGSGNYVWPVPGFHYISSDYYDTVDRSSMHRAIDIAGSGIYGTKVVAAASGKVVTGNVSGWGGGYGTFLMIDHGNNGRATLYAHMSEVSVSIGDTVKQGQTIGCVGNTGHSTGPHLHFETRLNGEKYNPMDEF